MSDSAGVVIAGGNTPHDLADVSTEKRLSTDARIVGQIDPVIVVGGGGAPSDLSTVIRQTPQDLLVDGSTTPVDFDFDADLTQDIKLFEIRFLLTGQDLRLDGSSFGASSALTNGIRMAVISNGVETEMGVVKINEDFFQLPFSKFLFDTAGPKDFLSLAQEFGGVVTLKAGDPVVDRVRVTVRDDLTVPALQVTLFETVSLGVKV